MMKKVLSFVLAALTVLMLFSGCSSLGIGSNSEISYEVENGEATVKEAPNLSTVTKIEIPDEYEGAPVTVIADFSVVNLESVEVISIGKNVREIGSWAFTNNQKLREFTVSEENKYFCAVDGVLFTKDMKTILYYPPAKAETEAEYSIPATVETVRSKAFYKCQKLKKISLPESVKSIEEKAFFRCSSLEELVLPSKLEFIGKDAFGYCSHIAQAVIPASVKEIGDYAFYNCTGIKTVKVENREGNLNLGKKWYPTDNGKETDVEIIWQ